MAGLPLIGTVPGAMIGAALTTDGREVGTRDSSQVASADADIVTDCDCDAEYGRYSWQLTRRWLRMRLFSAGVVQGEPYGSRRLYASKVGRSGSFALRKVGPRHHCADLTWIGWAP